MKNRKKLTSLLLIFAFGLLLISSCEKDTDPRKVTYLIRGLTSKFRVAYIDETGKTIQLDKIEPDSVKNVLNVYNKVNDSTYVFEREIQGDFWSVDLQADRGDILYLFLEYDDNVGMSTGEGFQFRILINGKVYKEAFGRDKELGIESDFKYRIIRQGNVPF